MSTTPDRTAWLLGGTAKCKVPAERKDRPVRLILLGAPGVGKGTQAEFLSQYLGACQLSTGDVFRAAKAANTCAPGSAMTHALEYMRRGDLVPDEIVLAIISERGKCLRCRGGFLLDGFPRTVAQAEALETLLQNNRVKLDGVLNYELPLEQIVARLSGRRTCRACKAVFHTETRPSKAPDVCDHCGGSLFQREDDQPATIRVRMHAYEKCTAPLTELYSKRGQLIRIPAEGSPEAIFERSLQYLNRFR